MTAVTPTDRPKSVCNRCVIEVFWWRFYVVTMLFGFFCGCMGVCHRTESDLFLFVSVFDFFYFTFRFSSKGTCRLERSLRSIMTTSSLNILVSCFLDGLHVNSGGCRCNFSWRSTALYSTEQHHVVFWSCDVRPIIGKGRDLTQSYDKSPYNHRKIQKATWQHKNATKTSITQRLQTDLGRSVGRKRKRSDSVLLE